MSAKSDQDAPGPGLSWESVVGRADDAGADKATVDASGSNIDLKITPLTLDPLPSAAPSDRDGAATKPDVPVLGDVHFDMSFADEPSTPSSTVSTPIGTSDVPDVSDAGDDIGLSMSPLDLGSPSSTGSERSDSSGPGTDFGSSLSSSRSSSDSASDYRISSLLSTGHPRTDTAPSPIDPVGSAGSVAASDSPPPTAASPAPAVAPAPAPAANPPITATTPVAPEAAVPSPAPTPAAAPAPAPAAAPALNQASYQPSQSFQPQLSSRGPDQTAPAAQAPAPAPVSDRQANRQMKLQLQQEKLRQKHALKVAKASKSGGASGVALLFTLLVLAALIAGAFVYGKPYLFPEPWTDDARPYGEAIESARGVAVEQPLTVQRRAADAYATSMAAHVVGPWEADLPLWRSLGLSDGRVDAPFLGELVEGWTPAFYSASTNEVIANATTAPATLDAAITEAIAAGAIDQETGWSSSIDDSLLDSPALVRADVIQRVQSTAAATPFGTTQVDAAAVALAAFLPPIIEYRVTAPLAYAEFATADPADFEALRASTQLPGSIGPVLAEGETLLTSQRLTDRSFWYAVLATRVDPAAAYATSNRLVQASLATADNAGVTCTYATFSGTDIEATQALVNVLQQWVGAVPAEMNASSTSLPDGTIQLRSCDPGAEFSSSPRFGVGREIARLRSVELAAVVGLPVASNSQADRAEAITAVRDSQIGLSMLDLSFDRDLVVSAETARELAATLAASATADG